MSDFFRLPPTSYSAGRTEGCPAGKCQANASPIGAVVVRLLHGAQRDEGGQRQCQAETDRRAGGTAGHAGGEHAAVGGGKRSVKKVGKLTQKRLKKGPCLRE